MSLIDVLWRGVAIKTDADNRLVTDSEKSTWNKKMDDFVDITTDLEITDLTTPGKYRFVQQYTSTGFANNITFNGTSYSSSCPALYWDIIVEKCIGLAPPVLLDGTSDTAYSLHEAILVTAYITVKDGCYCMQWRCISEKDDGDGRSSESLQNTNIPAVQSNSNVIAPFDTSKYQYTWSPTSTCQSGPINLLVDSNSFITTEGTDSLSGDIVPGRYDSPNLGSYGRYFGNIYGTNIRGFDGYFGGDNNGDYSGVVICETPNPNPIYGNKIGITYAILSKEGITSSTQKYGYLKLRRNDFYSVRLTPDLENGTSTGATVELPWQDGKLVNNMLVTDWNLAIDTGFYRAEAGASNAPVSGYATAGYVFAVGNSIFQRVL